MQQVQKYFFKRSDDDTYKETEEYELWIDLLKRQDKRDKKVISKLISTYHGSIRMTIFEGVDTGRSLHL
jgi:hypothetical protein